MMNAPVETILRPAAANHPRNGEGAVLELTDGTADSIWLQLTAGIAGSEGQSPGLCRKFVLTGK